MAGALEYRPSYCQYILDFMSIGYSITAFAGEIGVHRDTLYEWAKRYPDFDEAMKVGRMKRVLYLETQQLRIMHTGVGNSTSAIFALKNADTTEWREQRGEVLPLGGTGPIDGDIVGDQALAHRIAFILMLGVPGTANGHANGHVKGNGAVIEAKPRLKSKPKKR